MDFPQFELHGQIALVTGAARGIGRAISMALAHAGTDSRRKIPPKTFARKISTLLSMSISKAPSSPARPLAG
jgi:NAD(P)-dependent dehydrogenase (short-subunit alcohol dehydrogenase family)